MLGVLPLAEGGKLTKPGIKRSHVEEQSLVRLGDNSGVIAPSLRLALHGEGIVCEQSCPSGKPDGSGGPWKGLPG
jgi:hypothetical protein